MFLHISCGLFQATPSLGVEGFSEFTAVTVVLARKGKAGV